MSADLMQIVDVRPGDQPRIEQMALLLVIGFRVIAPDSWQTLDEAREEVDDVLKEGFCRAALDDSGAVAGWIGALPEYDGNVWELHPLVVDPARHGQGIGRALVLDLEDQVRQRGGITIMLGTDDHTNLTSLSSADLYADLPAAIANATASPPHPLGFYRRLGYAIVGVMPDANGHGKPDIYMAKKL
jgi:aminoglycoside 6'-N-acetyltransferase I